MLIGIIRRMPITAVNAMAVALELDCMLVLNAAIRTSCRLQRYYTCPNRVQSSVPLWMWMCPASGLLPILILMPHKLVTSNSWFASFPLGSITLINGRGFLGPQRVKRQWSL